jgi:uroporphyrinogen decarboxylase
VERDGTKTLDRFCGIRIKRVGLYDEFFDFPFANKTSVRDIRDYPFWPDPEDPILIKDKRDEAKHLRETTDRAILGSAVFAVMPFNYYAFMAGMERWLTDPLENPKFYFALCDKLLELGTAMMRRWLAEVGEYLDLVAIFDDIGGQEGLLFSPEHYKSFIHPYTKRIVETIKMAAPHVKIWRHSCGSCYEVIRDFIDIGIDVLHPAQPTAKNMQPWKLKSEFGRDITFATGIDVQRTLPFSSKDEIDAEVRRMIQIYAPGGGFIIAPTHNIEPDTPPENIVAAFDAAIKYGTYPISVQAT